VEPTGSPVKTIPDVGLQAKPFPVERFRAELVGLRVQLERMAEQHRSKKSEEFTAAYFSAATRLRWLEQAVNGEGEGA